MQERSEAIALACRLSILTATIFGMYLSISGRDSLFYAYTDTETHSLQLLFVSAIFRFQHFVSELFAIYILWFSLLQII